jgi:hypothetical protein
MEEDRIKSRTKVEYKVTIELSEVEVRALQAIVMYGATSFKSVFYSRLGAAYLHPHDKGIDSLFETIKKELPAHIQRIDDCNRLLASVIS